MSDVLHAGLYYICETFLSSRPPHSSSSVSRIQCKQTETAQVFIFRRITRRKLNFLIPGGSSPNLKRSSFWHSFTFPLRLNGTGWGKKGCLCLHLSAPDSEVAIMQGAC